MNYENDVWDDPEEKEEPIGESKVKAGEDEEEEEEVFFKVIRTVESHNESLNLLCTGAGMYLLGMSLGWRAFRVAHTRKALFNYKKIDVTKHFLTLAYGSNASAS
jgi:hypothetical protein